MRSRALLQNLSLMLALGLALCLALLLAPSDASGTVLGDEPDSSDPPGIRRGGGHGYGEGYNYRPGEVVVKLNPILDATIGEIGADYGASILSKLLGETGVHLLRLPEGANTEETARRMSADPRLLFAEPNFVVEAPEADGRMRARSIDATPQTADQYASAALNLPCARRISTGRGIIVAVLDTGAQLDHPALQANFAGVARHDFVDNDPSPYDRPDGLDADGDGLANERVGHGTHVSGIVDIVAPGARIMPLRVLDSDGYGDVFSIVEAVEFARRNGAEVINMSFSTPGRSRLLQDAVRKANRRGVIVAAAAGNENSEVKQYPAAAGAGFGGLLGIGNLFESGEDGLIAVTSVGALQRKSGFASFGDWVSVAAPGEVIRSAFPVGLYANWSGTSMATPFVAGQAALISGLDRSREDLSLSPAATESLIQNSARSLDRSNPVYAGKLGSGHADAGASLETLAPGLCPQKRR